eukprot:2094851-Prymnesium_polylepis.2
MMNTPLRITRLPPGAFDRAFKIELPFANVIMPLPIQTAPASLAALLLIRWLSSVIVTLPAIMFSAPALPAAVTFTMQLLPVSVNLLLLS